MRHFTKLKLVGEMHDRRTFFIEASTWSVALRKPWKPTPREQYIEYGNSLEVPRVSRKRLRKMVRMMRKNYMRDKDKAMAEYEWERYL